MKLIYTHENGFLVNNVKNIIEGHGIDVVLKNEFSSGAVGEVSAFDAWMELWVINDSDCERALDVISTMQSKADDPDWLCEQCAEENGASFDVCWNCQYEH
ncbi:DUF2007 domain-containing protein [Moritella dasanensis]|uniref:putative signal transducing protein n=1 Tax=Moritella dasanensis TaxID=428031 RepID=UPI0002E6F0D4|nr:DUF2007 domain-containing protein [Moritella dasanensis]